MLKVRLQGTTKEIGWFLEILKREKRIQILSVSEPYANRGTNKYFRVYAEIEKEQE